MGIATTTTPAVLPGISSSSSEHHFHYSIKDTGQTQTNSMSQQDYHHHHQNIFSFSNAFERSQPEQPQQQQHIAQQIRRDKLRVQGFEPPPHLVTLDEVESSGIPGYETAGMLSEMFNFASNPGGGPGGDINSLDSQLVTHSYRGNARGGQPPPPTTPAGSEWYGNRHGIMLGGLGSLGESKDQNVIVNERDSIPTHHHHHHHQQQQQQISGINADSAAAMQLFLMNPQPRSPSPTQSHPPPPTSSTLHMLLPNPPSSTSTLHHHHHQGVNFLHHQQVNPTSPAGGHFGPSQFTWVPDHSPSGGGGGGHGELSPNEIGGGVVEGQGLSLSLSSSLQHLEAAKAEELRMGDGAMLFFNQGGGSNPTTTTAAAAAAAAAAQYPYKNMSGMTQNHQVHIGFGSSLGMVNVLRSSKYARAAQELLEEFCSVGRGHLKKNKLARNNSNPNSNPSGSGGGATSGGGANSGSSSKDLPPLSAADRLEHQRRKVKLLSMLDEVDRRYNHYCEQMQMVVNSFDLVMGFGAAVPYTALAQKAMSRHFRCLKDAIAAQLKSSCEVLGEKDAGTSGLTRGETPRLKLLEQSLRQQRAFHQMGMMEQEAWRPQRGLPERSVNILRAWLFEHFLHPYPSDADKHLLARQTGLSRNQVSNWFINARVRLWKPMVEEMYQQESKDEADEEETETSPPSNSNNINIAQTPMPKPTHSSTTTTATATTTTPSTTTTTTTTAAAVAPTAATTATTATTATASPPTTFTATGKRSEINDTESDPSFFAINRQCFSETQAKHHLHHHHHLLHHPNNNSSSSTPSTTTSTPVIPISNPLSSTVLAPPISSQTFPTSYDVPSDACRRHGGGGGGIVTSAGNAEMGSTLIRFGTSAGDVSLTLGLRHAGNLPEKTSTFSVRDFGGC